MMSGVQGGSPLALEAPRLRLLGAAGWAAGGHPELPPSAWVSLCSAPRAASMSHH